MLSFLKKLFIKYKKLDKNLLPSQGLFYNDDFNIKIKRATKDEIQTYKNSYKDKDILTLLELIKFIVKNNIVIENYSYQDLKSIDVIYVFLEIVKFTKNEKIIIDFIDVDNNNQSLEFSDKTFNYYQLPIDIVECYDYKEKCFLIDDLKFTLPSSGVEDSISHYLLNNVNIDDVEMYNSYDYSFTYFVGNKTRLSDSEIENLIEIFNNEMQQDVKNKMNVITKSFLPMQKYGLKKDNDIINLTSKIDLKNIWN